jgi:hypothetical protein
MTPHAPSKRFLILTDGCPAANGRVSPADEVLLVELPSSEVRRAWYQLRRGNPQVRALLTLISVPRRQASRNPADVDSIL